MATGQTVRSVAAAAWAEFREKNVTFLAGSIAYTAFISLMPLLLFVVLALAVVDVGLEGRFLALVTNTVSPTIGAFIEQRFQREANGAAGQSLLGLIVLVWGALKLFRGLDTAFETIYEADAESSFLDSVRDGLVVMGSLIVAAVALVAVTAIFSVFARAVPYLGLLLPVVLAVGLVVALGPMYYVFPDTDVTAREVLPGVVVVAVGWALLQALFQVYVAVSTGGGAADLLTGVMLLLTWLYFGGVILLLGVVVNAVVGGHTDRTKRSVPGASAAD